MRAVFFSFYVEFGHSLCYKRKYAISARRISSAYTGLLMLVSAGGIVTLSCWEKYPVLWSVITLAAQVLQVLKPLTQAAKQRQALSYINQDASRIWDEIRAYWDKIESKGNEIAGEEISEAIRRFEDRMRDSEERFSDGVDFPFKKRLDNAARQDNSKYFWYHYGVKPQEGELI